MLYVLDTNTVSFILRNDTHILARFKSILIPNNEIIGCPIVWYEIHRGLLAKNAQTQMVRFEALFATFIWQDYERADWLLAAELWAKRRAAGRPIGDADLLIASFALTRKATLVTDNERDFIALGVTVENWTV